MGSEKEIAEAAFFAGADTDCRVKLFRVVNGKSFGISVEEWVKVLNSLGAEMGEMLLVSLRREPDFRPAIDSKPEPLPSLISVAAQLARDGHGAAALAVRNAHDKLQANG